MQGLFCITEKLKSLPDAALETFRLSTVFSIFLWIIFASNFQNGSDIAASITIIGCAPHSHQTLIEMILSPLHYQLMSSCQKLQIVDMMEFVRDSLPKQIPSSPW
eukprot:Lithocolla_globosa_v1_NODE_9263_length_727_cov_3.575893.p3 type:complete len:105 gc:universal NODE_9263_length_727_cov_3.575893:120-434(+)